MYVKKLTFCLFVEKNNLFLKKYSVAMTYALAGLGMVVMLGMFDRVKAMKEVSVSVSLCVCLCVSVCVCMCV